MPTVFIAKLAVVLPSRFAPGDEVDEIAAQMLNDIQHRRIKSRLRYLMDKGEISLDELQAKAISLAEEDLVPYATRDDDETEGDPVYIEALSMASELIITRMASEGLPPPKGLELHAKALVDGRPELLERARLRIEARYNAANAAIGEIV